MSSEQELREALKQVLGMVARGVPDLDTVIRARAALAAVPMQEVPAGFVLVPVEPTAEMLASLTGFDFRGDFDQRRSAMRRGAWAALLAAAPQASAEISKLKVSGPVAWRIFDGEGGYDYRDELPSEKSLAWSARYGREWEPLYMMKEQNK